MNPWDLPTTGNLADDDYRRSMQAWMQAHPYTGNEQYSGFGVQDLVGGGGVDSLQGINQDRSTWEQQQNDAYLAQLTPQQRAERDRLYDASYAKNKSRGQLAALASMAAVGGLGALGNPGAFASSFGNLGGAGMTDFFPEFSSPLLTSGGGGGGLDMGALSGIWDKIGGLEGLGKLGGAVSSLGGSGGSGGQQGSSLGGLLGNLGLGGAGLLYDYYNRDKMPGVPDFMQLANMTGVSANPNQTNAQGDTSTWTVDPTTGLRTQNVKYGAANQQAFDQRNAMAQALRNKIQAGGQSQPLQQVDVNALWG